MLIELKDVAISVADKELLRNVNFHVEESEFIYIIGKVGSGKSSLLKSLYAEIPINGVQAQILDYNLLKLKRKYVPALRRKIGIIFQDFQLLNDRTIFANLDFILQATGWNKKKERLERINEVLNIVELSNKANCFPQELSGGTATRFYCTSTS